jgi:hypothetical protein
MEEDAGGGAVQVGQVSQQFKSEASAVQVPAAEQQDKLQ